MRVEVRDLGCGISFRRIVDCGLFAPERMGHAALRAEISPVAGENTPDGIIALGGNATLEKLKEVGWMRLNVGAPGQRAPHAEGNFKTPSSKCESSSRRAPPQTATSSCPSACGAETDRRMGIPGEDLPRSHAATEFVGWFDGHPNYRDRTFDLDQETVAIVGQGNVAADVCRILAKPVDELRSTDITEHALDALARSRVREIHVIGRRGPVQAKFTTKELRELGEIAGCATLADAADLALNAESATELTDRNNLNGPGNIALFRGFAVRKPAVGQRASGFGSI